MENKHEPMHYSHAKHLLNPLRHLIQSPKKLVKKLSPEQDYTILELGPGPGFFSAELAYSVPKGKLILIDIQQEMLDFARLRLQKNNILNVEYIKADAKKLPLENETVDIAMLMGMFGEVPEPKNCLEELYRILKPNGIISITEVKFGDPDYIPQEELINMVEKEQFIIDKKYSDWFQYTINFKKLNK